MQDKAQLAKVFQHAKLLQPISNLNQTNLALLCKSASTTMVDKSRQLDAQDESRWLTFVMRGSVNVKIQNQPAISVSSNSDSGKKPLLTQNQSYESVTVEPETILLRFDRQQYKTLLSKQISESTSVADFPLEERDNIIFDEILKGFNEHNLVVPVLPEIAKRIMLAIEKQEMTAPVMAKIIGIDPVLSARVVQMANSPGYAGDTLATSLPSAISRLGIPGTKACIAQYSAQDPFKAKSQITHQRMIDFYMDSAHTASLSYLLAKKIDSVDHDKARLAGLVNELGVAVVLHYANKFSELFKTNEDLSSTVHKLKVTVSTWLVSNWGLGQEMSDVCLVVNDWYRLPKENIELNHVITAAITLVSEQSKRSGIPTFSEIAIGKAIVEKSGSLEPLNLLTSSKNEIKAAHKFIATNS